MPKKLILAVDDDPAILIVVQLTLEMEAGWAIITANSGQEGIRKTKTEQPDTILLDVMMSEMDGFATLEHLQTNPKFKHIPVIFLTAKAHFADHSRC